MVDLVQTVEVDLDAMDADQVLDRITEVRTAMARLKASDEALLDRLTELVDAGELDPGGFTHNDHSFTWSPGRKSWSYPAGVQGLEAQAKAAKKASEADGSAVATTGSPFWTIKPPKKP
jgi:hypothetical protein